MLKLSYLLILIGCLFYTSFGIQAQTIEIRKISPPKLEAEQIKSRVVSYRPMRKGAPALFLEKVNRQIIVHNYGHGGCGAMADVALMLDGSKIGLDIDGAGVWLSVNCTVWHESNGVIAKACSYTTPGPPIGIVNGLIPSNDPDPDIQAALSDANPLINYIFNLVVATNITCQ